MLYMALCGEYVRFEKFGFSGCCGGRESLSDIASEELYDRKPTASHASRSAWKHAVWVSKLAVTLASLLQKPGTAW